jgi:hypothetical protein
VSAQPGTGAPLVAGLLGGSGAHVVVIIVGIVMVTAVLSALIGFMPSRRGVGADVTTAPLRSSDGTLRLERRWTFLSGTGGAALGGANNPMTITIDGSAVGALAPKETVEVAVAPGHHMLRLSQGRHLSPERPFDVAQGGVVAFYCHGPRYGWPQLLAGLVKPDLWIALRRE